MQDTLEARFNALKPAVDFCSLRYVDESSERLTVRQGIAEAPALATDRGAMVSVIHRGSLGYAATGDLSETGIKRAFDAAIALADAARGKTVTAYEAPQTPKHAASYESPQTNDPAALSRKDKYDLLTRIAADTRFDERIIDWDASLWTVSSDQLFLASDGTRIHQRHHLMTPNVSATAHANGETQTRTLAGQYNGFCQQGGLEVLERSRFREDARRVAEEAIELALAPDCPTGTMDVLLMPDQMMLQIHESIGHPLELDRILGDERNFAGTSFVTLDMFGHYQYGSELLNVTYDPTIREQFASFAYDDDGLAAERQYIIEKGILKRPLGGSVSQRRANMPGVATTRACSWNRPPIDRMSNLNVEPGNATLAQLIGSIDFGVMMKTNCSWSIDDSRNKFQFGSEYGRVIRKGKLAEVVKRPNYRGISATFWRSLAMVGDRSTFEVMGTPYCGKGEPSQVIRVGHASPACKFTNVEVFGGGQ